MAATAFSSESPFSCGVSISIHIKICLALRQCSEFSLDTGSPRKEATSRRNKVSVPSPDNLLSECGFWRAVLIGMRIGEILALRWKYLDLLRGSIQIRETVSEGLFGSPKTWSSRRDVPMSDRVRKAFAVQRAQARQTRPEDLVFATRNQTPLNPKNLLRRVLRPTCDALKLPAITWHSFRHTHATLLGEVGESLRTAQALLGHSDLETTLNVYTHAIPESQRRAVDKVAEVLFADVRKTPATLESETVN
jgi:integrase